jgi:GH43 family beta-xylosidase
MGAIHTVDRVSPETIKPQWERLFATKKYLHQAKTTCMLTLSIYFAKRLALLLLLCSPLFLSAQYFQNQLRGSGPDPSLVYHAGFWYLTYTYGNQLVMCKAASIKDLPTATENVVWTDNTPSRYSNMWAPELFYLNKPDGLPGEKRWYLYYCADDGNIPNHYNYVLESAGSDPLGPYIFKNKLVPTNADSKGIDGSVLVKNDGSLYFLWSEIASNICIATMSNPWTVSSGKVVLATPNQPWEQSGGAVIEAPAPIKKGGKTFIAYSASHCQTPNYAMGLLTNTDGNYMNAASWTKLPYPIFTSTEPDGVYGPGGSSFFKSPDGTEDWMVYHATANSAGGCDQNRNPRVQRIYWHSDNTPIFPRPASPFTYLHFPAGDPGGEKGLGDVVSGGTYKLTHKGTNQCLDVNQNSSASGANVQQWTDNNNNAQRWNVTLQTSGAYKLTHKGTTQCLEVAGNSALPGANVQQGSDNGTTAQRWILAKMPDEHYKLTHSGTNQCLDVNQNLPTPGTNVQQWTDNGNDAQRWKMDLMEYNIVSGGTYKLTHKGTNQCLDVYQNLPTSGTNVQQWTDNGNDAQRWIITNEGSGFYKLRHKGTNQCLEVISNSSLDGANVRQATDNGSNAQRWKIEHIGDGYFKLTHKGTTKCLSVENNRSSGEVNVYQWQDNGNDAQRWRLDLVEAPAGSGYRTTAATEPTKGLANWAVFPNPTNGRINIRFPSTATGKISISLYDMLGNVKAVLYEGAAQKGVLFTQQYDISYLPAGTYWLKWQTLYGVQQQMLVKQ